MAYTKGKPGKWRLLSMELTRKCEEQIRDWLRQDHQKALLVDGARQVGKTHTIRRVLSSENQDYVEFNLLQLPELVPLLQQARTVDELVLGFSVFTSHAFIKKQTIIFIDEVQCDKEMVSRIKFLVDDGSYRFILSGSLLGIEITNLLSAPVGYLRILKMYPLDFEEFLQTASVSADLIEYLHNCFLRRETVMASVHDKLMNLYRQYLAIGGMPEAVSYYADHYNLNGILQIHRDITALYKLDFTQYEAENKRLILSNIYDSIPSQLLKQNRRFMLSDLKKGLHYERVESSFLWLKAAGVTLTAYNATEPRLPLKLNEKSSLFKLYLADVGMLTSSYGMSTKRQLLTKDSRFNAGGIYENAVAQELSAKGFRLYYYNSTRIGELDFVVEYGGNVLPIEVKSGKDYTIHSALSSVMRNEQYQIEEAFVFADCNISSSGRIIYYPVYMTMFLEAEENDPGLLQKIVL